jgi:hypothetical protein
MPETTFSGPAASSNAAPPTLEGLTTKIHALPPKESPEYLRGLEQGRKEAFAISKSLAPIELLFGLIDKGITRIDRDIVRRPEFQKDWQENRENIRANLKIIHDKMYSGDLDIKFAIGTLKITTDNLDAWDKAIGPAVQNAAAAAPAQGPSGLGALFPDPATNPRIAVTMPVEDYTALQIFKMLGGISAIEKHLKESQPLIKSFEDLKKRTPPEEGIGREFGRMFTPAGPSLNELQERERLKNKPR